MKQELGTLHYTARQVMREGDDDEVVPPNVVKNN